VGERSNQREKSIPLSKALIFNNKERIDSFLGIPDFLVNKLQSMNNFECE